ncbi:hypothetical protein [Xenorhabdus sp. BG5]|nr:hypothetical protein [Xenorhabdus sp. BG5]
MNIRTESDYQKALKTIASLFDNQGVMELHNGLICAVKTGS